MFYVYILRCSDQSLYVGHTRNIRRRVETHKVELRNRKDEVVTVFIDEKLPAYVNWKIDNSTHKYKKRDARTARFEVELAADSVVEVQYTVTQTW